MERAFLFLLILTTSLLGFAQKIELEGTYQGRNIYVQNPPSGTESYCTEKILVNGNEVPFKHTSAYEIRLDTLELKIGDPVKIEIFHKPDCKPKVLTDNSSPKNTFEMISTYIDTLALLHWTSKNEIGKFTFKVEQYRWNKWIKVGEVDGIGGIQENTYAFKVPLHSGKNQFRVEQDTPGGKSNVSKSVYYTSQLKKPEMKRVHLDPKSFLEFDEETMYEIFDQNGNLLKIGTEQKIDCRNFKKGAYYINYDNVMGEFVIY